MLVLVMAVGWLELLPRRSLASMAAGLLLVFGSVLELMLVAALVWGARKRPDLQGRRLWLAVGFGLLVSLPVVVLVMRAILL